MRQPVQEGVRREPENCHAHKPENQHSQRAQYPLMKEYTLNHNIKAPII